VTEAIVECARSWGCSRGAKLTRVRMRGLALAVLNQLQVAIQPVMLTMRSRRRRTKGWSPRYCG